MTQASERPEPGFGLSDARLDEYCRTRYPDAFAPTAAERADIRLSYLPTRAFVGSTDLRDVESDLAGGMVMERRSGDRGPYYVLSGTRYDVFANPIVARDNRLPIADVSSIKPRRGLARRLTIRPARVLFHDKRDEAYCDLPDLLSTMDAGLATLKRRLSLRRQLIREMGRPRPPDQPLGDLRAEAWRHYAALRMMLDLIAQRSRLEGEISAAGRVIGVRSDEVYVRLGRASAEFAESRAVEVVVGGQKARTRLQSVEEYEGDLVFSLAPPRSLALAADTAVRLRQDGRFAMRRHRDALDAFLAGDVEGEWEHLALLLCRPGDLPAFTVRTPERFLSETTLNDEQRAAVAGALSTPHAFLVQGPPGTGKSTVITELALQMTARGERVLVLAPMHVAVDEVLGRIADQPGIFALRIAGDDRKVREDLHRLLPDQVAQEYLRAARTPATSQAAAWQAEIARLASTQRLVGDYLTALEDVDAAASARSQAEIAYASWCAGNDRAVTVATARHREAGEAMSALSDRLIAAHAHRLALQSQLGAVPGTQRFLGRMRGLFGMADPVSDLARAHTAAAHHHERLLYEYQQLAGQQAAAATDLDRLRGAAAQQFEAYRRQLANQDAAIRTVGAKRDRAADALMAATGADPAHRDIASWQAEHRAARVWIQRLEQRIALEQRWFHLSGLSTVDGTSMAGVAERLEAELRQAANLVCATTTGVVSADLGAADFDTLIVDEASRVVDSEFLIGAVRARRWILVGDQRQLPPYVEQADEHHLHALTALHLAERDRLDIGVAVDKLGELWREEETAHAFRTTSVSQTAERLHGSGNWRAYRHAYRRHLGEVASDSDQPERVVLGAMRQHMVRSLFERCAETMPPDQFVALRYQHRSIDAIAALVRGPVYKGRYESPPGGPAVRPLVVSNFGQPVVFADTSARGDRAKDTLVGHGFVNELEAQWVRRICTQLDTTVRDLGEPDVSVSVLTFYQHQSRKLRELLGHPGYAAFPALNFRVVDVIDRIQGQQSDVVLLSFCRARPGRRPLRDTFGAWLQDVRRLNVAVTRARRGLFLVGHAHTLRRLNGIPEAEEFYRHLFDRIATGSDSTVMVRDL